MSLLSNILIVSLLGPAPISIFEWLLHRYVMHRPFFNFKYPYQAHALVHHTTFRADHTYHLHNPKDKYTIPMAWWNGAALVLLTTLLSFGICHGIKLLFPDLELYIGVTTAIMGIEFALYYTTYEYIHWCMHLPKDRKLERVKFFFRLNGHHLLHHRYPSKNFNVVLPFADLIFGTLLRRSPAHFKQPIHSAVPDVQPRVPLAKTVPQ